MYKIILSDDQGYCGNHGSTHFARTRIASPGIDNGWGSSELMSGARGKRIIQQI